MEAIKILDTNTQKTDENNSYEQSKKSTDQILIQENLNKMVHE